MLKLLPLLFLAAASPPLRPTDAAVKVLMEYRSETAEPQHRVSEPASWATMVVALAVFAGGLKFSRRRSGGRG